MAEEDPLENHLAQEALYEKQEHVKFNVQSRLGDPKTSTSNRHYKMRDKDTGPNRKRRGWTMQPTAKLATWSSIFPFIDIYFPLSPNPSQVSKFQQTRSFVKELKTNSNRIVFWAAKFFANQNLWRDSSPLGS